jgi:UDP-N-acetylglucosamine 2-epimerase (non-hydrolysing)
MAERPMIALVAFGTRPEAIKLAPVITELQRRDGIRAIVALTAQHRQLVDQVLRLFSIQPDIDLDVMREHQTLPDLSHRLLTAMDQCLRDTNPDVVIVQGDTTSAFLAGLAAFYRGIPVAHVEAGLRTTSALSPFPEEMNRRLTSALSFLHFAPTDRAREALLAEGIPISRIFVTGNSVVDALQSIRATADVSGPAVPVEPRERLVLVTMHRRETWGNIKGLCGALRSVVEQCGDVRLVIPVHPNPRVHEVVHQELGGIGRINLIESLDYASFVATMAASHVVVTDSGGVQEEAPALGVPVLVLREITERPEATLLGVSKLIGTDPLRVTREMVGFLNDANEHARMARTESPFGDGHAAGRIADLIEQHRAHFVAFSQERGNPRRIADAETNA